MSVILDEWFVIESIAWWWLILHHHPFLAHFSILISILGCIDSWLSGQRRTSGPAPNLSPRCRVLPFHCQLLGCHSLVKGNWTLHIKTCTTLQIPCRFKLKLHDCCIGVNAQCVCVNDTKHDSLLKSSNCVDCKYWETVENCLLYTTLQWTPTVVVRKCHLEGCNKIEEFYLHLQIAHYTKHLIRALIE